MTYNRDEVIETLVEQARSLIADGEAADRDAVIEVHLLLAAELEAAGGDPDGFYASERAVLADLAGVLNSS